MARSGGLWLLSGSLHDHSSDSDGDLSSRAIVSWEFEHRAELGIDFAALTEHADLLPFALQVPFGGNVWRKQAALSRQFSRDGFSFLRGFEFTSDQENHMNVIGSEAFLGGARRNDFSMAALYHWLEPRSDGIAQFNHPSGKGALQWDNLAYVHAVGNSVATIEIPGDQNFFGDHLTNSDAGWYWLALVRGWTVGPVMNWDTHHWHEIVRRTDAGERCGELPHTLPCQRTLVLADAPTPDAIMHALRARRTSATEHPSLWATLRGPAGIWQGSTVHNAIAGTTMDLTVEAGSSIWSLTHVDIISDEGIDPHPYYDGDNAVCDDLHDTPCENDRTDFHDHGSVRASFVEQHRRFVASHGYAVRKAQIDGPPGRAMVASVALSGHHALTTIHIAIPRIASRRPDQKHFFYAIVWAGSLRSWTSPIFTEGPTSIALKANRTSK